MDPVKLQHPYANVDIKRLDTDFLSLINHAASSEPLRDEKQASSEGLSERERRLFRWGLLVGLGEWDLATEDFHALIESGLIANSEAEQALTESIVIKGWTAGMHLGPAMATRGLWRPANMAEVVKAWSEGATTKSTPGSGLTERDIGSLGLGVAWGAKCWDT